MNAAKRWGYLYCILAGACDSLTGILLLADPLRTLALMRIPGQPAEPIYLRFIGVFVMSVGLSYLIPFLTSWSDRVVRLTHVLGFTAFIRLCIASFIAASVAAHALAPGWLAVFFTDATFATIQIVMLNRNVLHSGP